MSRQDSTTTRASHALCSILQLRAMQRMLSWTLHWFNGYNMHSQWFHHSAVILAGKDKVRSQLLQTCWSACLSLTRKCKIELPVLVIFSQADVYLNHWPQLHKMNTRNHSMKLKYLVWVYLMLACFYGTLVFGCQFNEFNITLRFVLVDMIQKGFRFITHSEVQIAPL